MAEFFGSLWWYLVTIGVLVTFHEFGHFWVARRCGVKVLRFSIGFGTALWRHTGKDGTEYVLAAIPLGGYVSMLDERAETVPAELRGFAHNNQSTAHKIAIAAAGPGFNFLLAILAFWLMFAVGKPDYQPILGRTSGLAASAGLSAGSKLLAVDETPVRTWSEASTAVLEAALYRRDATVSVREADGDDRRLVLAMSKLPRSLDDRALPAAIGLALQQPAVVGQVLAGDPAARAGLQTGDVLLAINQQAVSDFNDFYELLQDAAGRDPNLHLQLRRGQQTLAVEVIAKTVVNDDGSTGFRIGIGAQPPKRDAVLRYGPLAALPAALAETWTTTTKTFGFLRDMLVGVISPRHLSGPITIARVANAMADYGLAWFLGFLGAVSVGIAILNLLPVPILDGGHILSYLIESVQGRPLSERVLLAGQYLGLAVLAGLIGLALFNDVLR